ncbi:MAG: hypothetical protein ABJL99_26595 [Aliishimia sp.]
MPDWRLDPGLTGCIKLIEAYLYGLSLRGLFQGDLDWMVRKELNALTAEMKDPAFLRKEVSKLWARFCALTNSSDLRQWSPRSPWWAPMPFGSALLCQADVVTATTPSGDCPDLPTKLILLD